VVAESSGISLRVAPGSGLVGRRGHEVVFSPTANGAIADAFTSALSGSVIDAVTALVDADPGAVDDFVVIQIGPARIRIAVFGAVEVTSDHRSLPRLSAAGAGTWVERSLSAGGAIVVRCGAGEVLDATSLVDGVVIAGGLALSVAPTPIAVDAGASTPKRQHRGAFEALIEPDDMPVDMPADQQARAETAGPPAWQIVFEDGRVEPVDAVLVLGRDPDVSGPGTRAVAVDCELVSANHLQLREQDGTLLLTDLGSRNRTFVLTTGDAQFVPIEAHRAHRVDDASVVQLGRQRFTVEHPGAR
jgi:hypothetical protein